MSRPIEDILRDDKGRFSPKETEPAEAVQAVAEAKPDPVPEPTPELQPEPLPSPDPAVVQEPPKLVDPEADPKNWTYAAYRDEKSKRQDETRRREAAEHRAQELERRFQEQQQQEQAPDQFADPDGYRNYMIGMMRTEARNIRAENSLQMAHDKHGELFEQAYAEMLGRAQNGDPSAVQSIMQSANPGQSLVSWYKRDQVLKEVGEDPDAYKARIRDELKAELLKGPSPASPGIPSVMPTNLAAARSVAPRTGPAWSGPQPITDIFDRRAAQLGKR